MNGAPACFRRARSSIGSAKSTPVTFAPIDSNMRLILARAAGEVEHALAFKIAESGAKQPPPFGCLRRVLDAVPGRLVEGLRALRPIGADVVLQDAVGESWNGSDRGTHGGSQKRLGR
jgi:hypothetical protein